MLSLFYNSTLAICSDAKYETISELRIHIKQSYFIHKKMWKNSKNNFDNTRQGSPKIIKFVHSYPECYYYYMIYLSIYLSIYLYFDLEFRPKSSSQGPNGLKKKLIQLIRVQNTWA